MAGPPPEWQFVTAASILVFTGFLSVLGSSFIVYSACKTNRHKLKEKANLRLLLGMSIYDLWYSLGKGCFSFLLFPEGYGLPQAKGNMTTCSFQGFTVQMAYGTGFYNACLCMHYYLTICRGMPIEKWNRFEPFLHGFNAVLWVTTGIVSALVGLYNPMLGWCFITSYPPGCESGPEAPPCERFPPETLGLVMEITSHWWLQLYYVIVIYTNTAIWWKVRKQGRKNRKYAPRLSSNVSSSITSDSANGSNTRRGNPSRMASNVSSQSDSGNGNQSRSVKLSLRGSQNVSFSDRDSERERQVAVQCLLYTVAFALSWSGPLIWHLYAWITGAFPNFTIALIVVIFTPLQGFSNAAVYGRPTYLRIRRKYPMLSRWRAWYRVFFSADPFADPNLKRATSCTADDTGDRQESMVVEEEDCEEGPSDLPTDVVACKGRVVSFTVDTVGSGLPQDDNMGLDEGRERTIGEEGSDLPSDDVACEEVVVAEEQAAVEEKKVIDESNR